MNGTTNSDRTNYFQNVPTPALDMALWMESDRMGHLLGAVTQENWMNNVALYKMKNVRAKPSRMAVYSVSWRNKRSLKVTHIRGQ